MRRVETGGDKALRIAFKVSIIIALSKIAGFAREIVFAAYFGAEAGERRLRHVLFDTEHHVYCFRCRNRLHIHSRLYQGAAAHGGETRQPVRQLYFQPLSGRGPGLERPELYFCASDMRPDLPGKSGGPGQDRRTDPRHVSHRVFLGDDRRFNEYTERPEKNSFPSSLSGLCFPSA